MTLHPHTEQALGLLKGALHEAARQLAFEFSRSGVRGAKIVLGAWREEADGNFSLDARIEERPFCLVFSASDLAASRPETLDGRRGLIERLKPGLRQLLLQEAPQR
ncbi:MAG TPA: hypothetical protein VFU47_08610 [Armatimonadota bacterium]|nr:hypothetical protein [Armatimonadota bacterium]